MMTPEELIPIARDAIGAVPLQAACRCQGTWTGDEGKLPPWYLSMRSRP